MGSGGRYKLAKCLATGRNGDVWLVEEDAGLILKISGSDTLQQLQAECAFARRAVGRCTTSGGCPFARCEAVGTFQAPGTDLSTILRDEGEQFAVRPTNPRNPRD